MTIFDENEIEKELQNHLRGTVTDPNSRGTDATETFDGDAAEVNFTLANVPNSIVTVETPLSTFLEYGTDYTFNESTGVVTFTTAPGSGTGNIRIIYKHGETWIYEDFSKPNITVNDFPRVSASIISVSTVPIAIGGKDWDNSVLYSVTVAAKKKKTIRDVHKDIRTNLLNSSKSFFNFPIIEPSATSAYAEANLPTQQILQKTVDYIIPHNFEVAT